MTTRKLHDRAREHVNAAKQRSQSSAFGDHYRENHPFVQDPKIEFSILRNNNDTLRLHIIEAMEIQARQPELNRRQELLSTGFLP